MMQDEWSSAATQALWRLGVAIDQHTLVLRVEGNAMSPELTSGDCVLVDRTRRDPRAEGLFAIRDGTAILVRHVSLVRNTHPLEIEIACYDKRFHTFRLALGTDVEILGRVAARLSRM